MLPDSPKGRLGEAWLVLILALVFGATLASVHVGLRDRIEANKRAEILRRIPRLVLGDEVAATAVASIREDILEIPTGEGQRREMRVDERTLAGMQVFEVLEPASRQRLGWVARGSGQGYADTIEVLVGLAPDLSVITGLYVLSQKETPALGDGITREPFRRRFVGAPTNRLLEVTRIEEEAAANASRILALTAATVSSQSVCDIVNATVARVRQQLVAEGGQHGSG